jgi:hypothetical protein
MSIHKGVALGGLALVVALVTVPLAMSADGDDPVGARTYVVRTLEDPSIDPIPASDCPGGDGVLVNANGYAHPITTRASDGMVVQEKPKQVGVVRTCARITPPINEGTTSRSYAVIDLGGDRYTASGACRVTSNGVPQPGVILAGCALRLLTGPAGFVGGSATSASLVTFGPIPGFHTGSFWTLRVFASS